jgi:hypothetical protein
MSSPQLPAQALAVAMARPSTTPSRSPSMPHAPRWAAVPAAPAVFAGAVADGVPSRSPWQPLAGRFAVAGSHATPASPGPVPSRGSSTTQEEIATV